MHQPFLICLCIFPCKYTGSSCGEKKRKLTFIQNTALSIINYKSIFFTKKSIKTMPEIKEKGNCYSVVVTPGALTRDSDLFGDRIKRIS